MILIILYIFSISLNTSLSNVDLKITRSIFKKIKCVKRLPENTKRLIFFIYVQKSINCVTFQNQSTVLFCVIYFLKQNTGSY